MSQERPNNTNGWKSNLDGLDLIPGESVYNPGAAWDKLEKRMAEKKRAVTPLWYWIAAACLALALMVPFITGKKTNTNVVQVKKQAPVKIEPSVRKDTAVDIVRLQVIHKRKLKILKPAVPAIAIASEELIPESIRHDTIAAPQLVNFVTPRKKLQVVHINEIIGPGNNEQITWHTRSSIHFNERKGDNFTKAYAANSSDNIIKIKLPSN